LCTPKINAYPVLENAVECSDAEQIDFVEIIILNLKIKRHGNQIGIQMSMFLFRQGLTSSRLILSL